MRRWHWSLAWAVLRGRIISATCSFAYDRPETIIITIESSDGAGGRDTR